VSGARSLAVLVASAAAIAAACDATSYYLYTGHEYDAQRGCVSDLVAIDVDIGSDPGSACNPTCLTGPTYVVDGGDGGVTVYATTMCGPTPAGADPSGGNPACPAALAALARQDFCLDGGGSTNPLDGGAD
jgi:hypothetical protein